MTAPSNILTNSSCTLLQLCQQKYYWRYEKLLAPVVSPDSEALSAGCAFHIGVDAEDYQSGLEKVNAYFDGMSKGLILPEQFFKCGEMRAKVQAMVQAAWIMWPNSHELREVIFEKEIKNPDTLGKSKSFVFKGKVDSIEENSLLDWKTVADAPRFLVEKRLGYQLSGYIYGLQPEHKVLSVVYRLVERPTIRRYQISKSRSEVESEADYEKRCYEWLLSEKHLWEEEILFTQCSLDAFEIYLWQITQQILWARRNNVWLRNISACYHWNRSCEYLPLCAQLAAGTDIDAVKYDQYITTDPHPELEG